MIVVDTDCGKSLKVSQLFFSIVVTCLHGWESIIALLKLRRLYRTIMGSQWRKSERWSRWHRQHIVVFHCECFRWKRNALLNAKLSGRDGRLKASCSVLVWDKPLLCVCPNSTVTGKFHSFINVASGGTSNAVIPFTHSVTRLCAAWRSQVNEKWFCCSRK